jgi:hypothetical protein
MRVSTPLILTGTLLLLAASAFGTPCTAPDVGGTVTLPPVCQGGFEGNMVIVDGLPPGSTLEIEAVLTDFYNASSSPGGSLGGELTTFQGWLQWDITGTGDYTGFYRTLAIPVSGSMHSGPRNPGDPVQAFEQIMFTLQGELYGDPDFCELVVVAGNGNGLPSPGSCTLTELPSGDFAVDSFFDITYQIQFQGCPGSILDGLSGVTTDTRHFHAGEEYFPPIDHNCLLPDDGTGTITLPPDCPDGFEGDMVIVDGLPAGTTIEIAAVLTDFSGIIENYGGALGGMTHDFDASLYWSMTGTGELAGFQRNLVIPVGGMMESGPRNPGDLVQTFAQDLVLLQGELFGDPDFCTLRVECGSGAGLPSPGSCTLERVPSGDFAVDSFFDITYQIEFEGCPGSQLEDLMGTTMGNDRFQAGEPYFPTITHSCILPNNGLGTVDMPPDCPDGYTGAMVIVDGLPAGTTIAIDAVLTDFYNVLRSPGGILGGEVQIFDANLYWALSGTGDLLGFARNMVVPVECEVHTGPRNPGDPVQTFGQVLYSLQGQLYGDPDFCELIVTAGNGHGLPSPGSTTLTELPSGDFAVDSFFDITYQIDFQGCPGSILEDLIGSTIGSDHFHAGEPYTTGVPDLGAVMRLSNHPNPFNPLTTIAYEVPANAGVVSLDVYDLSGRHVRTLVHGRVPEGLRTVNWAGQDDSGRRVAAGVYLCALKTDQGMSVKKMALIK